MNRKTKELIIAKPSLKWDHMEWDNREAEKRKILEKCGFYLMKQDRESQCKAIVEEGELLREIRCFLKSYMCRISTNE